MKNLVPAENRTKPGRLGQGLGGKMHQYFRAGEYDFVAIVGCRTIRRRRRQHGARGPAISRVDHQPMTGAEAMAAMAAAGTAASSLAVPKGK
jgi:hypothetical protein